MSPHSAEQPDASEPFVHWMCGAPSTENRVSSSIQSRLSVRNSMSSLPDVMEPLRVNSKGLGDFNRQYTHLYVDFLSRDLDRGVGVLLCCAMADARACINQAIHASMSNGNELSKVCNE